MPDATEIALITSALPATLTFLFQRAEHLLGSHGIEPEEDIAVPDVLVGTLQLPLQPDADRLHDRRRDLELLRDAVADHADGGTPVPQAQGLLRNLGRLRAVLEDVYSQHLTFDGEDRPASGPYVYQKATTLTGQATGMDADEITGNSRVVQDVGTVVRGATMVGMKAKRIGPQ